MWKKAMENLRSRINVKLGSIKKYYLQWTSKPSYLSHKIFDNDLVLMRKRKVPLTVITNHWNLYFERKQSIAG